MTFTISKEFEFSASHQLWGLPEGHQCGRLHGHNYKIIVILESETVDQIGFVRDYGEMSVFKKWIDENLDHKHLNDFFNFNPTAELMAVDLYRRFRMVMPEVKAVKVSETPKTWAMYSE